MMQQLIKVLVDIPLVSLRQKRGLPSELSPPPSLGRNPSQLLASVSWVVRRRPEIGRMVLKMRLLYEDECCLLTLPASSV